MKKTVLKLTPVPVCIYLDCCRRLEGWKDCLTVTKCLAGSVYLQKILCNLETHLFEFITTEKIFENTLNKALMCYMKVSY